MTQDTTGPDGRSGFLRLRLCWGLFLLWLGLMLAGQFVPSIKPIGDAAILVMPLIFFLHGSVLYGWSGILAYTVIGLIVGFSLEASSVATGFPFGHYTHNVAGPKPAGVPIIAIVSYMLVGWFAWTIGKTLVLDRPDRPQPLSRISVPVVAAFALAGFDLVFDQQGATIRHDWTYHFPSGQFGVPLTNFLGWIFTGWVLFQAFALIEQRFRPAAAASARATWLLPCLVWLAMAVPIPFQWLQAPAGTASVQGRTFVIADIFESSVILSLFLIVAVAVLGIFRLYGRTGGWQGKA